MVGGKVEDRLEDHVHWVFSTVVDRESVSPWISLCPVEDPRNLLAVRIRCVSVVHTYPHMYPRRSTRLATYSDMYVKDEVLLYTMKCKTW